MPETESYLCIKLLTESAGQTLRLFLTRRCLMEQFFSKPAIPLPMLKKIKKHSR